MVSRRARMLVAVAALAVAACGQTGGETTRIDQAETEVTQILDDIAEQLQIDADEVDEFGQPNPCELVTTGTGWSNNVSLRTEVPDVDDPIGRSSAVLVDAGYQLVDSEEELGEGVFGRRDGIRITVVLDHATDELAIDAHTGCRPAPST